MKIESDDIRWSDGVIKHCGEVASKLWGRVFEPCYTDSALNVLTGPFILDHLSGVWVTSSEAERAKNLKAVEDGTIILTRYDFHGVSLTIVTAPHDPNRLVFRKGWDAPRATRFIRPYTMVALTGELEGE